VTGGAVVVWVAVALAQEPDRTSSGREPPPGGRQPAAAPAEVPAEVAAEVPAATPQPAAPAPPPPAALRPLPRPRPAPAPAPPVDEPVGPPLPEPPAPRPAPAPAPSPDPSPGPSPAPFEPAWWSPPTGLGDLLPDPPSRGLRPAVMFGLLALVSSLAVPAGRSAADGLLPNGVFPRALRWLEVAARILTVVAVIGLALALIPERLAPAVPWMAVAAAAALGWSARDVLPDLVAWVFLAAEGRLRAGTWVEGDGFEGRVSSLRPRATWVVDPRGRFVWVPNRRLIGDAVRTDGAHPEAIVTVAAPDGVAAEDTRRALREAVLLSPWVAPGARPEIAWDSAAPGRWTVRVRLLDLRFRDRFAGTLPERVQEVLEGR
jgi:hypothetical protein